MKVEFQDKPRAIRATFNLAITIEAYKALGKFAEKNGVSKSKAGKHIIETFLREEKLLK